MTETGMRSAAVAAGLAVVVLAGCATGADAQPLRNRYWVTVDAGVQMSFDDVRDRFEFDRNVEAATATVEHDAGIGPAIAGGFGVLLSRNGLGAAVAVSRFSRSGTVQVEASIAHPFFFDRPREVSGEADDISRSETGIHGQLTYTVQTRNRLRVMLGGGVSVFNVEQELVTAVRYTESFPFDEAEFAGVDTDRSSGTAIGFNAGVDIRWLLSRTLGVGGLIRYSRGTVDLDVQERTVGVEAGGLQALGGIRVFF
jgi:hypothetical protein